MLPRNLAPAAAVALVTMLVSGLGLVSPSWACGCGAFVVKDAAFTVHGETSIVRWDGRTEQIIMRLAVQSEASDAAWILPTPVRAAVELGKTGWFHELEALTKPRVVTTHTWWPPFKLPWGDEGAGGVGTGAAVQVLDEQRIGPFEVATLAADDSGALAGWLDAHGYRLDEALADALAPYVEMGWTYVAIKLVSEDGEDIDGNLPPLRVTFTSDQLVYPMRLSRLAEAPQELHLYVLAPHRVERTDADAGRQDLTVGFAGWVEPQDVSQEAREIVDGRVFLTEFAGEIPPESVTGDFWFRYADRDEVYEEVEYRKEGIYVLGVVPGGWALVFAALILAVAGVLAPVVRLRRTAATGASTSGPEELPGSRR